MTDTPSCFCTISTKDTLNEARALLYGIQRFHPSVPIYIACDSYVCEHMQLWQNHLFIKSNIHLMNCMDSYSGKGRAKLEADGLFLDLLACKMKVLEEGIREMGDSMYIDSDVILLGPVTVLREFSLILSPAHIDAHLEASTGRFNAGYIWSSTIDFPLKWREMLSTSSYYDQQCLDHLSSIFGAGEFHEGHNIMPWRIITPNLSYAPLEKRLTTKNGCLRLGNHKVVSVHSHFHRKDFARFNKLIIRKMMSCFDSSGLAAVNIALMA